MQWQGCWRGRGGQVEAVKYMRAQTVHWLGWLAHQMRLREEIDQVIDEHGGWPDAFVTDTGE